MKPCSHATKVPRPEPRPLEPTCPRCRADGTDPVQLRLCLACGYVGCCESAQGHALDHFRSTGHPVMRSHEPGESWRWCYVDGRLT